jgi:hypothetical protein
MARCRDVPTVLRKGSWRFYFYSNEGCEPPHVHVAGEGSRTAEVAKFWLSPVRVVRSRRIPPHELHRLARVVAENRDLFLRRWDEHFATD